MKICGYGNALQSPAPLLCTDLPYKVFFELSIHCNGCNLCSYTLHGHANPVVTSVRFACAALHVLAQCILNIPYIFALNNGSNSGNLWTYFVHARAYQSHDLHYNLIVPYIRLSHVYFVYLHSVPIA